MPQVPQRFDAVAVRAWCGLALEALGRAREEIDAINVYPVADGDTGTNLYLTVESAAQAVEAAFSGLEPQQPSTAEAMRAMAHGALIGARGNSGTIVAQLLRGMAQVLAAGNPRAEALPAASTAGGAAQAPATGSAESQAAVKTASETSHADGPRLRLALRRAAESAYEAVAHPVEGTVLTVASAAADAAEGAEGDCATVARAAYKGARAALDATPGQLAVLGQAGVVDAGGRGLLALLGALVQTFTGEPPTPADALHARVGGPSSAAEKHSRGSHTGVDRQPHARVDAAEACPDDPVDGASPAFEVIYLLEADDAAVAVLRTRLDALGDSLVVVGGDGLWNVHVHVDDAGAAVEAGVEAGRPYRIRITHFGAEDAHTASAVQPPRERAQRAIVAVVPGEGLRVLYAEAGATTVPVSPGERPASGELVDAIRHAHAREVVLLPNDAELRHTAAAAAEQARSEGLRVALIPTRSAVQGIAALAVHEPDRRFDEDVVAMTSAAGATRHAEVVVAERQSWTMAGICQAGDVLGLIDGDVAVIGSEVAAVAETVLDRMLAAGGEMVTLVLGDDVPDATADGLEQHVRENYLAVDTVVYRGGRQAAPMLIGVE
ncbi:DAK2 domain-containing protein [Streptomyces sp. PSKA54]|uniref:DAK2 domain-containing protein n=1 Tax=Streptomyces himalayensis subsp. aureolus TaxID=2758039 RepID=A0A7W2D5M8_9ACTN|nr:DAK2 domain-containing protein [Streptomyces himalayensis]MBA4865012.1 DAK2 domain-containing protein [Streptomyces himalayensis subsp. aureolus]